MDEEIKKLKRLQEIQFKDANNDYMIGMYNGMEVFMCILEKREPVFLDCKKDKK